MRLEVKCHNFEDCRRSAADTAKDRRWNDRPGLPDTGAEVDAGNHQVDFVSDRAAMVANLHAAQCIVVIAAGCIRSTAVDPVGSGNMRWSHQ